MFIFKHVFVSWCSMICRCPYIVDVFALVLFANVAALTWRAANHVCEHCGACCVDMSMVVFADAARFGCDAIMCDEIMCDEIACDDIMCDQITRDEITCDEIIPSAMNRVFESCAVESCDRGPCALNRARRNHVRLNLCNRARNALASRWVLA